MLGLKLRNACLQTLLVVGVVAGFGLGRLARAQAPPEEATPETPPDPADPRSADPTDEPVANEPVAEESVEPAVDENEDVDEIVVTGSTIRRRDLVTPSPVLVFDRVELDAAGVMSLGDILQNLTAQSNAINVQLDAANVTRVNLRGIGTTRTLVLVNGRRHVPGGTGADGSVDLNSIPVAIIKRVEVLKDGSSAVYGSDAIGGVINIITRTDFEGTEARVFTAGTKSGGSTLDISVTTGHRSDRGGIVFSAGYYKQNPVWTFERPDWATPDRSFDWAGHKERVDDPAGLAGCDQNAEIDTADSCVSSLGSTATPQGTIIDRLGEPGNQAWQDIVNNNPSGVYFNDPTVGWRDFRSTGNFDNGTGDLFNYQPANHLITPQQRYNLFSTGNFTFHDNVRGYFEASYINRVSDHKRPSAPLFTMSDGLTVSADNFYNPFGRNFIDMRRRVIEAGNRSESQDIDTFRFVGGFDGELPIAIGSDWKWDLAYNFGRTQGTEVIGGRLVTSRLAAAIGPSFVDANGNVLCGTPGNVVSGCVPLNLFGGAGTITQDMLDYVTYTGISRGFTEQQSYTAGVTGKLGEIPFGGDVGVAVGVEHRQLAGARIPDPIAALGDTTVRPDLPTAGSYDVNAAYAELDLIVLKDRPGVETLELIGAVRAFDYSSFGGAATWKVGGRWQIIPDLAIRATRSTAFRAPSLGELFLRTTEDFPQITDPCDTTAGPLDPIVATNCAADGLPSDYQDVRTRLKTSIGGNPALDPETADVWSVGAVFEPRMLKGLTLSLDFYHINVQDTISALGVFSIFDRCYRRLERSNCDQVNRNAQGVITSVEDTPHNVGETKTAGLDLFASYDYRSPVGKFRFTLDTTWLEKFNLRDVRGSLHRGKGVFDLGLFPTIKWNFSTAWTKDNMAAGLNVRFIGGFRECEYNNCSVMDTPTRDVDASVTTDIYASYALDVGFGETKLTLGINNALDQDPPVIYNGYHASTDPNTYDFLGRFFYLRLAQTL